MRTHVIDNIISVARYWRARGCVCVCVCVHAHACLHAHDFSGV